MKVKKSDVKQESSLRKAVKNVKQILKKKKVEPKVEVIKKVIKQGKDLRRKTKIPVGIVYIGHIPHGFYEEQMKDYFSQFGKVTRVRVARSKKNGRSRGYGYVEFAHPEVAEIAAKTMNNYLMCGRLIKANYIPPEKQHKRYFMGTNWSVKNYAKLTRRRKEIRSNRNLNLNKKKDKKLVERYLTKLASIERKLKTKGIEMKITPVDVPEVK
ncbi:MKI67 FHA domain-interacting nucleolar phosphoprotein-like [Cephus cinctus]|uniref:MKI67 FHA domain-interacting nucleolar phosphoprotein-like n=1 Tax=Cephus cinctus TaxID=211228 RepID=A0AAJ7BR42_CEPCN|nr:MKI67 FHA domain-interacting nucleolar phosphoprotein-like [Cephus cinctus]